MGKQLNYHMTYDGFLQVAQAALDEGCLIIPKKRTASVPVPSADLSTVTPDCCGYWFYLPELADLELIQDNAGYYYPNYSFNLLGLAMIETGFSRTPAETARMYVMTGFYNQDGQWIARSERITAVYNKLAKIARKTASKLL